MDRKAFFDHARAAPFGGRISGSQFSGMTSILDLWEKRGGGDPRHLAYALATTFHETATTMQPVEEYGKGHGQPYGVPAGPWRLIYDGRGDVQLTWLANYQKATTRLRALGFDVDLVRHPEQAMRPDVAAMVLLVGMAEGWFTGKKLGDYFGGKVDDAAGARRIINGTDKAAVIAGYHRSFLAAVKAAAAATPATVGPAPKVASASSVPSAPSSAPSTPCTRPDCPRAKAA